MKESCYWEPIDHVCRFCGARIMHRNGKGLSVGDVYKCFTCGKSGQQLKDICWCGFRFRKGNESYRCLSTKVLEKYPEVRELLEQAFRACGVNPREVEVGVVTLKDHKLIMRELELRRVKNPILSDRVFNDLEEALSKEKEKKGTPYSGLYLEKLWRDYLARGESPIFVRALILKIVELL